MLVMVNNIINNKIEDLISIQHTLVMYLLENGAKTRDELLNELKIPKTTLYDNLRKLEIRGIVLRSSKLDGKKGRPPICWQVDNIYNLKSFKLVEMRRKRSVKVNKVKPPVVHYFRLMMEEAKNEVNDYLKLLEENEKEKRIKRVKKIKKEAKNEVNDYLKLLEEKKRGDSYILNNKDSKLVQWVLRNVNRHTFFRIPSLRRSYNDTLKKNNYTEMELKSNQSVSGRIGKVIGELRNLGIIILYSSSTYKNLYKGQLYDILNEKIEQNYNIKIKLKDIKD